MTTFTPDTPAFMISDYTEERCHELALPVVRDDNGLTVTVPAKPNGLPDWERFLAVAKELQAADGWVMEGAKPYGETQEKTRSVFEWFAAPCDWFFFGVHDKYPRYKRSLIPGSFWGYMATYRGTIASYKDKISALADLSSACVAYSRSGGTQ